MRRAPRSLLVVVLGSALLRCGAGGAVHAPVPPRPSSAAVARPAPPRYEWIGIVGTGQSLSVGASGRPVLTTTQPFHNLKLQDDGPTPGHPLEESGAFSLVPLVEPIRPFWAGGDTQYPSNIFGETPHSAMANQLTALAGTDYVTLHSAVGWGGRCMSDIDKTGSGLAYPSSLWEARTFRRMADARGKTFAYGAVVLTHGECDAENADYEGALYRLWSDYDADLRAITGQKETVPLLLSQQNTFPGDGTASASTLAQWSAGVRFPGKIVCVGPKYQYAYAGDKVHLDAASYRRLGEKYAEVFDQVFRQQRPWAPLQPRAVKRDGRTLTVTFHVPHPPLGWDETLAPPHQTAFTEWAKGRGFEVATERGPLAIASVAILGDAVVLTLTKEPADGPLLVRYAMLQDAQIASGGDEVGRRGQLRDSDPLVGWDAETIPCNVEQGSSVVTATEPGAFARRTLRDVAAGAGPRAGHDHRRQAVRHGAHAHVAVDRPHRPGFRVLSLRPEELRRRFSASDSVALRRMKLGTAWSFVTLAARRLRRRDAAARSSAAAGGLGDAVRDACPHAAGRVLARPWWSRLLRRRPMAELQLASLKAAADAINQHDARKYAAIFTRDAIHKEAAAHDVVGREDIARRMQLLFTSFPDFKFSFDRVWQKGNVAVATWHWNGTDTGGFLGEKATGRKAGVQGVSVGFYNSDGLVREIHVYEDGVNLMQQLDPATKVGSSRVPPPEAPGAMEVIVSAGGPDEAQGLATAKTFYDALEAKKEPVATALFDAAATVDDFALPPLVGQGPWHLEGALPVVARQLRPLHRARRSTTSSP